MIQHSIWKVGAQPTPLLVSSLASERLLEEMITCDLRILSDEWMLIGSQEITRQWDESSYFAELEAKVGPKQSEAARRILAWSRQHATRIWWGQGNHSGSFIPVLEEGLLKQYFFAVFTGAAKSRPTIQLYFSHWAKRPPFADITLRQEMITRLNTIKGVSIAQSSVDKWPTIALELLVDPRGAADFPHDVRMVPRAHPRRRTGGRNSGIVFRSPTHT